MSACCTSLDGGRLDPLPCLQGSGRLVLFLSCGCTPSTPASRQHLPETSLQVCLHFGTVLRAGVVDEGRGLLLGRAGGRRGIPAANPVSSASGLHHCPSASASGNGAPRGGVAMATASAVGGASAPCATNAEWPWLCSGPPSSVLLRPVVPSRSLSRTRRRNPPPQVRGRVRASLRVRPPSQTTALPAAIGSRR